MTTVQLSVKVTVQDGASKIFQTVGREAEKVGDTVSKAGRDGAKGMDELGKSAEQNASKLDKLRQNAAAIGTVMGTVASGVALAGNAYRDQERTVDGLTRAYGDQSVAILAMTEDIQDFTRYSNDAARESALIASSLANNYDLSAQQISALIERSADLAQIFGISLPDAVQRTSAALRGEGESAEALSLNMSDAAMAARALEAGIVGWSVPGALSEAEKAAFRFSVLMEDSQYATGAAAEAAEGAGGAFRGLVNDAQDLTASVGGALGPIAEMAAELQGVALWLPIVGTGIGAVVRSTQGLTRGWGGVALAAGGAIGGGYLLYKEINDILHETENQIESIEKAQAEWFNAGDVQRSEAIAGWFEYGDAFKQQGQAIDEFWSANVERSRTGMASLFFGEDEWAGLTAGLTENLNDSRVDVDAYVDYVNGKFDELYALQAQGKSRQDPEVEGILEDLNNIDMSGFYLTQDEMQQKMEQTLLSAEELKSGMSDLTTVLDDMRISGEWGLAEQFEDVRGVISQIGTEQDQGIARNSEYWQSLSGADREAALAALGDQYSITAESATQLTAAEERIFQVMETGHVQNEQVIADIEAINALREAGTINDQQAADQIIALSQNMSVYVDFAKAMNDAQLEFLANGDNILNWWQEYDAAINQGAAALDGTAAQMDALNARMAAQESFRGLVGWAEDIEAAGAALDGVLRTYEQIDTLGQRSASAGSIAENLVGAPGEWAAIDDLVTSGMIGWEEYNGVVRAGTEIMESNSRVQMMLNEVRADQLPLLAEQQVAYEQNIARLDDMTAAEQQRALMLQDSAGQAQIAAQYNTAYAASIGKIPEAVATEMILESTAADAGLRDILLQMGLLEEVDGEIRVNFPNADATVSAIDRLTISILEVQAASQGMTGFELAVKIHGEEEAMELYGLIKNADGTYSEATLAVASTGVEQAVAGLREVQLADGTVVTVKTEVDTTGWSDLTAAELATQLGEVPVETVIKPPDNVSAEEWNSMIGPFPPIEVPITPTMGNVEVGDGTAGASNWADLLVPVTDEVQDVVITGLPNTGTGEGLSIPVQGEVTDVVGLEDTAATITVEADATQALGMIESMRGFDGLTIATPTVEISGENSDAMTAIEAVQFFHGAAWSGGIILSGDNSGAMGAIGEVRGFHGAAWSAAIAISGDNAGAMGAINEVAAYDGTSLGTAYFTVTTREVTEVSRRTVARHGGIPGYAMGGVVVELAEAGPEMLHLATGGTAYVPERGVYEVPRNTYVSPANAVTNNHGGTTVNVTVQGNVVGVDDLEERIGTTIIRAMAQEAARYRRSQGATY